MMAYIQLSLYGIPAKVILGDSLAWRFSKVLYTPFYFVNGLDQKLKRLDNEVKTEIIRPTKLIEPIQLNLFLRFK